MLFTENFDMSALLLEHVPAAVAFFDRDMRYLACSHRWIQDYRLEGRDIIGHSHYDIFPEIDASWRAIHQRALRGETLSSNLDRFQWHDGSVDWIQWKIVPWHDALGVTQGVALFTQVVTDKVETNHRASTLSRELDLLIDSATSHALCLLDPQGRIVIWNAGAERLYGWKENEVLGKPYDALFGPNDLEADLPRRQLKEARQNGTFRGRSWRRRKDGAQFVADVTISPILDEKGNEIGFGQVVRDVTDEEAKSRAIESREAQLLSILDTVPDAMITIDENGLVESFSAAAVRIFGYEPHEVIGKNISMLMPEPDASRHDDYIASYNRTGVRHIIGMNRRVLGQRKDGTIFPHELSVGEASAGGRRIFTGFLRDLSAREEAEAKLEKLQSELLRISRISAAGTMATALAHEINQPLTAISNYVQSSAVLLDREGEEALELVRSALVEAGQEALRAGAIVQRLREFVSRGDLDRTMESPVKLATEACALGSTGGKSRGIACEIEVPEELPPVLVDRVQIQQVLLNLLRNGFEAIGENGKITVAARLDSGMIRFTIADDGPGLTAECEAKLFEPFASTKADGMGMGLSICSTIVEAHGGRLWHEALPDGAAFHFTVPTASKGAAE